MKKYLLALAAGLFLFTACDNDDNHSNQPNGAVTKAFEAKFPHASRIEWEYKNDYAIAEFHNDGFETDAWFDQSGKWYMTKTEYRTIENIPNETVRNAFQNSEYKTWRVEDVDYLNRLDAEGIYIIEVEQGKIETDLYYSEEGILIKAIPDDGDDYYENYLPGINPTKQVIIEIVQKQYPNAKIIEIDMENGFIEVEIIDNGRGKEVIFDNKQNWINTHYDVRKNEVEQVVINTINKKYAGYHIDDIEKYETPTGNYYQFELELGEKENIVKIGLDGKII